VEEKHTSNNDQSQTPGKWVSVESAHYDIFFSFGSQTRAHQLSRSASINCRKQPGAQYSKNEEKHSLRKDSHLEKAGEDRKVNNRFRCLAVIGCAQARNKGQ
jgi:hypothetical protein